MYVWTVYRSEKNRGAVLFIIMWDCNSSFGDPSVCFRRVDGIPVKETDMDRMFDYFSRCLSQNFFERRTESFKNGSLSSI